MKNNLNNLTTQIKLVNIQRDLDATLNSVITLFKDSKLGVNRKKGKEFSPLDQAINTAESISNINKLKQFAFNTVMKGEGLGVL
jgi:hypothetical protein